VPDFRAKESDARLRAIAAFVRPGVRVADIGADHAYLSLHLVRAGIAVSVIATDIAEQPAARARANLERAGLSEFIQVRRGDGLVPVAPDEVDDIVVAGMGGEQIADILRACPWRNLPDKRWIFAPATRARDLRAALPGLGLALTREAAVEADGRVYTVMLAQASGRPAPLTPLQACVGLLPQNPTAAAVRFVERERAYQKSDVRRQTTDEGRALVSELERTLTEMRAALTSEGT